MNVGGEDVHVRQERSKVQEPQPVCHFSFSHPVFDSRRLHQILVAVFLQALSHGDGQDAGDPVEVLGLRAK